MNDGVGTILVVDDHREAAEALAALVHALGYRAVVVYSGAQALEYVRTSPVSLMLLDLQMPGMSGFDVLLALRADDRLSGIPVIACSAAPAAQVSDRAKRLGARNFVAKEDAFEQLGPAMAKLVA